jgi:hypothetical protein
MYLIIGRYFDTLYFMLLKLCALVFRWPVITDHAQDHSPEPYQRSTAPQIR